MSAFDPSIYLNASFTEPTKKRPPLDVGDYNGILGAVKVRTGSKERDGVERPWLQYEIPVTIEIPSDLQSRLGLTKGTMTLTYGIFVDLTETGMIDMALGRNRGIRVLREAVDKNKAGDIFSPAKDVEGRPVRVKVINEMYQGDVVDRVDSISKL